MQKKDLLEYNYILIFLNNQSNGMFSRQYKDLLPIFSLELEQIPPIILGISSFHNPPNEGILCLLQISTRGVSTAIILYLRNRPSSNCYGSHPYQAGSRDV